MKKFLSTLIAVAMLICTFVPMTAAAPIETITLPSEAGSYIQLEMENYNDQFMRGTTQVTYDVTENSYVKTDKTDDKGNAIYEATETSYFSEGKGVYSGSTSMELETLTLPVSVDKDTVFEMEMVGGIGNPFHKNYWSLDNQLLFYTSEAGDPVNTPDGARIYFANNQHFPVSKKTYTFVVPAGTHNLVYNIGHRDTQTGAFALDYLKFTAVDAVLPTISFGEGATATATANGRVAAITFTDSGVETAGSVSTPVDYYYIEVYPADVKAENNGMCLSYTFDATATTGAMKEATARPTNFTAHVPLSQLERGTYYAKIYPVGLAYESIKGAPIQTDVFTVTDTVPGYAFRYELEDYWTYPIENTIASSAYASGGKMVFSTERDYWISSPRPLIYDRTADTWQDVYEITVDVNLPTAGVYTIDTVMGRGDGEWTDKVEVYIDDAAEPIYINSNASMQENVSVNGSYPYGHIYAGRYSAELELAAGEHTATFKITRPSTTEQMQPHLFMLDYIQFTPHKAAITKKAATIFEMEDYADQFFAFDEEGNTEPFKASLGTSGYTSGGKFANKDFTPTMGRYPAKVEIPVTVRESGLYTFDVMDSSAGCTGFVSLTDGTNTYTPISLFTGNKTPESEFKDVQQEYRKYYFTYYDTKWHQMRLSTGAAYLPAGEYTMTVQYNTRTSASAVAFCIDYVKVSPCVAPEVAISANDTTMIEMDELTSYFVKDNNIVLAASVQENAKANNGKLATKTETKMETGHSLTIPVNVEKAGWYDIGTIMSSSNGGWISENTISVDKEPVIIGNAANAVEDLSEPYVDEDGQSQVGYLNKSYPMRRFSERIYLEAGEHEILFHAAPRTQKTDTEKTQDEKDGVVHPYVVNYYIDYISLAPVADSIAVSATSVSGTVVYPETAEGKLIAAAYNGKELVGTSIVDIKDSIADISISCDVEPDCVKVFVWSDLNALAPVADAKIFELN